MSYLAALSKHHSTMRPLTMERISQESSRDPMISSLIQIGVWPKELQAFHQYRADLTTADCMVLYKGRALVPTALQAETLDILHSGHQGVTAMNAIAGESVFWPGMSEAIARRRLSCRSCDRVTPSQPASPPHPLPQPAFPFEMICTDYFSFAGRSYFIIVDRYSVGLDP